MSRNIVFPALTGREILLRLELEAALVEETSSNASNASEEAHELAKRAVDSTSQVTDEIWLLEQRYVVHHILHWGPAHVVQWSNHLGAMCSRA